MPALTQLALVGIALLEPSSAASEAVAVRAHVAPSCPDPADIARRIRSGLAAAPLTEPLAIDLEITARRGRATLELEVSHRLFTARERYHDADCDALVDMAALYVASIFPTIHAREQEVAAAAPAEPSPTPPPTRRARRKHRRHKGTGEVAAPGSGPRRGGARASRRHARGSARGPDHAPPEDASFDAQTPAHRPDAPPRSAVAARVSAAGAALLGGDDPNFGLGPDLRAALVGRRWRIEAGGAYVGTPAPRGALRPRWHLLAARVAGCGVALGRPRGELLLCAGAELGAVLGAADTPTIAGERSPGGWFAALVGVAALIPLRPNASLSLALEPSWAPARAPLRFAVDGCKVAAQPCQVQAPNVALRFGAGVEIRWSL